MAAEKKLGKLNILVHLELYLCVYTRPASVCKFSTAVDLHDSTAVPGYCRVVYVVLEYYR